MATSSPPSKAIFNRANAPSARSLDGPFSRALNALDDMAMSNIALGPAMPEAEAIQFAAQKANISPDQALAAYLAILDYE